MSIQVGDKVPATTFKIMTAEGPQDMSSEELFAGKKSGFLRGAWSVYAGLFNDAFAGFCRSGGCHQGKGC